MRYVDNVNGSQSDNGKNAEIGNFQVNCSEGAIY